jgi:catechol 2,3-dioxygenase-like lactoylglutathione lyase family enzyme
MSKAPFTLGVVGHFSLAVHNPKKSAEWFERAFGLEKEFKFENGIAVGNKNVTIALFKGKPAPNALEHMSFHLPKITTLRKALAHLKEIGARIEDPDDEIGPEAPGSPHMGLWVHDPDGYRWELSVQGEARESRKAKGRRSNNQSVAPTRRRSSSKTSMSRKVVR